MQLLIFPINVPWNTMKFHRTWSVWYIKKILNDVFGIWLISTDDYVLFGQIILEIVPDAFILIV